MFRCLWIFAVILATPCWAAEQMYSIVLGATGSAVSAMAIDSQGNAYVGGSTGAADFPVTPGAFQTRLRGFEGFCDFLTVGILGACGNAFVAKLDPNGKIVWATFLGGSVGETVAGIGFDSGGNVLVAGSTGSPDFPMTTTIASGVPASFVAKLSPDGSSLIYSFLFSGGMAEGLAVGPSGNAYVVGFGYFGTATPDAFQTQSAGIEGYVGKVSAAGTGWDYLTFLSASGTETATGIAVNANGEAYVAGTTTSPNLPGAYRGARKTLSGDSDAFVAKFNASGSGVFWSTYLGVGGASWASIALDPSGSVYVASTGSTIAPTLCKLSPDGSAFVYSKSTPINAIWQSSLAVNAAGEVYLGGTTGSLDLPVTPGALEGANYNWEAGYVPVAGYILKLDGTGSNVLYASYFGGGSGWSGELDAIGLDAAGHLYAAGYGYPLPALFQESGFVVKADLTQSPTVWVGAVVNSASFVAGTIVPGELVTLFGAGIGPATPVAGQLVDGTLPTELGGVKVLVGGVPAPLLYVSSGQINAVVPFEYSPTSEFQVSVQGLSLIHI